MKILNFGSCNIDYVYSLEHIVKIGETETTRKREIFPGGKGLNQSIAIAKAGANVYHAGVIGRGGEILKTVMEESGVDISYLEYTDEENGHAIIQVSDTGENSIFLYPGSNEMVKKEYVDNVLSHFEKGDIILLQNEINYVDYIIDSAYKKQMTIILNPSPFNERMANTDFNKIDYIILNEVEAEEVTGCNIADKSLQCLKEKYPKIKIILTLGSKGSVYYDGENKIFQPAFNVDTVDTTAAGDTFTGYFIAELAKETRMRKILKTASAASAIAVSREGASSSIPDKFEVEASLEKLEEKQADRKNDSVAYVIDKYMEENIKNASLEELAEILGYSTVYTGNMVKKLTGKSFSETVLSKRCEIAAEKLLKSDLPIDEIINDVGYENKSFFRKLFKEKYGKTPLEYRKNG